MVYGVSRGHKLGFVEAYDNASSRKNTSMGSSLSTYLLTGNILFPLLTQHPSIFQNHGLKIVAFFGVASRLVDYNKNEMVVVPPWAGSCQPCPIAGCQPSDYGRARVPLQEHVLDRV